MGFPELDCYRNSIAFMSVFRPSLSKSFHGKKPKPRGKLAEFIRCPLLVYRAIDRRRRWASSHHSNDTISTMAVELI